MAEKTEERSISPELPTQPTCTPPQLKECSVQTHSAEQETSADSSIGPSDLVEYLNITWQSIRFNEEQRNKFFNFYIVIAGASVVLVDNTLGFSKGESDEIVASVFPVSIPIFTSLLVNLIGLLFISIFLRARVVIVRDLAVIKYIHAALASRDSEFKVFKTIESFYSKRSSSIIFRSVDNTFLITFTVGLISTAILYFGFSINSSTGPLALYAMCGGVAVHALASILFHLLHSSSLRTLKKL